MATKYTKNNDHYVKQPERETLRRILREENISIATLAYEMRMTRTHVSGLLGGSKRMAMTHKLAVQFVILKHRQARLQNMRQELVDSGKEEPKEAVPYVRPTLASWPPEETSE